RRLEALRLDRDCYGGLRLGFLVASAELLESHPEPVSRVVRAATVPCGRLLALSALAFLERRVAIISRARNGAPWATHLDIVEVQRGDFASFVSTTTLRSALCLERTTTRRSSA